MKKENVYLFCEKKKSVVCVETKFEVILVVCFSVVIKTEKDCLEMNVSIMNDMKTKKK